MGPPTWETEFSEVCQILRELRDALWYAWLDAVAERQDQVRRSKDLQREVAELARRFKLRR